MSSDDVFDKMVKLPIWKEKYEKLGVTPRELYMRQNGLCYLIQEVDQYGSAVIYCTDGKDRAKTANMLNPTIECVKCISSFAEKIIENEVKKSGK